MGNNRYAVKYLPSFNKEFQEIIYYITYILNNKIAAEKLVNKISKAIMERSLNPLSFEKYHIRGHNNYSWYRIYVDNYIIFYIVKDYYMIVARILYQKRNFKS